MCHHVVDEIACKCERVKQLNNCIQKHSTVVVDEDDVLGFNDEFLPGGDSLSDADDAPRWERWQPDPPDAQPGEDKCAARGKGAEFRMRAGLRWLKHDLESVMCTRDSEQNDWCFTVSV